MNKRLSSVLLFVLDLLVVSAFVAFILSWFYEPEPVWLRWYLAPLLALLVLFVLRAILRRAAPDAPSLLASRPVRVLALALLPTFFMLFALEILLAICGVKPEPPPPIIITGQNTGDLIEDTGGVRHDPELLFAFVPDKIWDGVRVNSHGYRTREFDLPKTPGTIRIVSLGDSCTAQGRPPYADRLHELLQKEPPVPGVPWEAFNMGVFGYSSWQGYRAFERLAPQLGANLVTLYFGWNDHWTEHNVTDRHRMASRMGPFAAKNLSAFRKKRLYAVILRAVTRVREKDEAGTSASDDRVPRVPPAEYANTLRLIAESVRQHGGEPLFLTAPRRHLTDTLVKTGHARSPEEAEELHDRYVEITRSVARDLDAPLLDLAEICAAPEWDGLFSQDGIHWVDPQGLDALANVLYDKVAELAREGRIPGLP